MNHTSDDAFSTYQPLRSLQSFSPLAANEQSPTAIIDKVFPNEDDGPPPSKYPGFANFISFVIIVSSLQTGAELQWRVEDHPDLEPIYGILNFVVCVAFIAEISVSIRQLGMKEFFTSPVSGKSNTFDFVITAGQVLDIVVASLGLKHSSAYSSLHLQEMMRLARCFRILRLLRILRRIPTLVIVVEGVLLAVPTLAWIMLLLALLHYVFAILFTLELKDQLFDDHGFDRFGNTAASMLTLLDIVMGATWVDILHPMLAQRPLLVIPFFCFVLLASFGVVNVIIGVIVDATAETRNALEWRAKREKLGNAANMWWKQMESNAAPKDFVVERRGCSAEIREETKAQKEQRRQATLDILSKIIESNEVRFPSGSTAEDVFALLDQEGDGHLTHEEFTIGIGRLLLGDHFQQMCMLQTSQGHLRQTANAILEEVRTLRQETQHLNNRIDGIESQIAKLPGNALGIAGRTISRLVV